MRSQRPSRPQPRNASADSCPAPMSTSRACWPRPIRKTVPGHGGHEDRCRAGCRFRGRECSGRFALRSRQAVRRATRFQPWHWGAPSRSRDRRAQPREAASRPSARQPQPSNSRIRQSLPRKCRSSAKAVPGAGHRRQVPLPRARAQSSPLPYSWLKVRQGEVHIAAFFGNGGGVDHACIACA